MFISIISNIIEITASTHEVEVVNVRSAVSNLFKNIIFDCIK